jgi:putative ABC transport system permease protein
MSDWAPPRLPRALLGFALPSDVRDGIVGDLDEVYRKRRSEKGWLVAFLWYWGQLLAFSLRLGPARVREIGTIIGSSAGLDVKLGLRMLVKYPMLTIIGGVAITVASAIGVGAAEFVRDLLVPSIPLDEGDRLVTLRQLDLEESGPAPASWHDYLTWRESVESVAELGAFTVRDQGLVSPRGESDAVSVARVTASAFDITRVQPGLGRYLIEADEQDGATPVIVLGHETWQALMDGDPQAVGQTVQVGGVPTIVVGVMPEGYRFPRNQNAWVPLRFPVAADPASSPRVSVFGRLAEGASLETARAELTGIGARAAADYPETHAQLRPELYPFANLISGGRASGILYGVRAMLVLLLMVACANVATLVFARTVTREGEIAVRTALGATRKRIVLQLFAEALVLVAASTLVGMGIARWVLGWAAGLFWENQQEALGPFWWDDSLSLVTIAYAGVLAFAGAVMIGIVPALKATGARIQPRLSQLSAGGGAGLRFGGMWTAVIVFQVALSVAFLPLAVQQGGMVFYDPFQRSNFPADQYITAQLARDVVVPPRTAEERAEFLEVSAQLFDEVRSAIATEPGVSAVSFASGLSGFNHVVSPVEFRGDGNEPPILAVSRTMLVDQSYLDLMGAEVVSGRSLQPADFTPGSRVVVVNESFVRVALSGRNAVGGMLRGPEREGEASEVAIPAAGESYQIVGVVKDPEVDVFGPGAHQVIYAPITEAPVNPGAVGLVGMPAAPATQLFVHLRPQAEGIAASLHTIVASVDPSLRLSQMGTVQEAWRPVHRQYRMFGWIFMLVAGVVLALSVAGIYALMSFSVSRRTREIAIRAAVGASQGRILGIVFRRAAIQLLLGVVLGSLIAVPVVWDDIQQSATGTITLSGLRSVFIVVALLTGAGLCACLIPIRRALAIAPVDAIKSN